MVEVFKTNVAETDRASKLLKLLKQHFPHSKINFDLEDCDKVLRMEGPTFPAESVIQLVQANGYACSPLE